MYNLPIDIIKYVIVPMLDYDTRLNLNVSLNPEDRCSPYKFSQKRLLEHERCIFTSNYFSKLYKVNSELDNEKKGVLVLDFFELLKQPSHKLIFDNKNYVSTYVEKIREFSDPKYQLPDSKYKKQIQDSVAFLSKNIPVYDLPFKLAPNNPISAFDEAFTYKKNV